MTDMERRAAREARRKEKRAAKIKAANAPYDNFDLVCDPENLYKAFRRARRGVSWKASVQRYEANLFKNIAETAEKLKTGADVRQGFVEFDLYERGKKRHIKSVHIKERVVQKCLCDEVLVPVVTRTLIHDNGASRLGYGMHFALKRLIKHLRRFYITNGKSNDGYALVVDLSKYFDSIRHDVLLTILGSRITDTRVLELVSSFIGAFGNGVSLGLGSQVSQIGALFYCSKHIDHYAKDIKQIKFYGRYMDDIYFIHRDKEYLKTILSEIEGRCAEIGLTVNWKKTRIVKLKHGLPFLKGKYILTGHGKIVRLPCGEAARRRRRKLRKFYKLYNEHKMTGRDIYNSYEAWRGNYRRRFNAWFRVKRMDELYHKLFIQDKRNGS
jgi:hypothetical protein